MGPVPYRSISFSLAISKSTSSIGKFQATGWTWGGAVDVSAPGSTASVEVYGLPVGKEPYVVELSAVSVDQQVTCRGSAEFDIEVGVSTPVMVILNCKLPQELGSVRVNGKFNICAQLTKMVVAPLQTSVGNDISLFSAASDEEGDPIAYMWSSHSGSIADPVAASTTYTCTEVGDDDITVLVTDDDGIECMSMWTVRVTCVAGEANPCDDVTCEDDGNECTDEACNPANGMCETSNNTNACENDTGTCNAGVCEANAEVVYEQDFNQLDMTAGDALTQDGWLVFGNVFDASDVPLFNYGVFGAPNGGQGFSAIVDDQGGPAQDPQQLSVYNDYGCCQPSNGHFNGTDLVESLVFQEPYPNLPGQRIPTEDIGKTLTFSFDAKNGNIQPPTTALAYIQTLDPAAGFNRTNYVPLDMTSIGTTWGRYELSLDLTDPLLVGQILQFGFQSKTSNFADSQNVYDNILVTLE